MAQREHVFAIVDEVDSILIDEARTPLIISGPADEAAQLYYQFASIVRTLTRDEDYEVDEEKKTVVPLEPGIEKVEKAVGVENIYDDVSVNYVHQLTKALTAKDLYKRDKDYLVAGGEVKIIDEFTGRALEGRRWSDGLHQAVEAKERVAIKEENHTWATVTLQNYFRMYEKLSGMTGTAETEAGEFAATYGLPVVPIPTNREMVRGDQPDLVFKTEEAKFNAVVDDIVERHELGQPMLIGTASVAKSELLARLLEKRGIPHEVLNAKQHFREAEVVAQAGRRGAVTVATNMAGRGVDIILGGNPELLAAARAGGRGRRPRQRRGARAPRRAPERGRRLDAGPRAKRCASSAACTCSGSERHESRRIDNQLRGRSGRQGDPGESRFYLSLGRRAAAAVRHRRHVVGHGPHAARRRADRVEDGGQGDRAGAEHRRGPQRRAAQGRPQVRRGHGPAAQGHLRAPAPDHRRRGPRGADRGPARRRAPRRSWPSTARPSSRRTGTSRASSTRSRSTTRPSSRPSDLEQAATTEDLVESIVEEALEYYEQHGSSMPGGEDTMRQIERDVYLQIIDARWRDHLAEMDNLKDGIHLRWTVQADPLNAWQQEGYNMFGQLLELIDNDYLRYILHVEAVQPAASEEPDLDKAVYAAADDPVAETAALAAALAAERGPQVPPQTTLLSPAEAIAAQAAQAAVEREANGNGNGNGSGGAGWARAGAGPPRRRSSSRTPPTPTPSAGGQGPAPRRSAATSPAGAAAARSSSSAMAPPDAARRPAQTNPATSPPSSRPWRSAGRGRALPGAGQARVPPGRARGRGGPPDLWDDPDNARAVTKELGRVSDDLDQLDGLRATLDDAHVLLELYDGVGRRRRP